MIRLRWSGSRRPEEAPAQTPLGLFRGSILEAAESGARKRVGTGDRTFLILAGPVGEPDDDNGPTLYWWDGLSETVTPGPAAQFDGMAPEALIAWDNGVVQILGDNEANCSDGSDQSGPARRFPSIDVTP